MGRGNKAEREQMALEAGGQRQASVALETPVGLGAELWEWHNLIFFKKDFCACSVEIG